MNKLFTRYMNSAAVFSPDKDGNPTAKEKLEAERKSIKVDSVQREEEIPNPDQKEEDDEDDKDDDNDPPVVKEPENETEDQKKVRLAKEQETKEERKKERQQRKWDKLAAEKTAAERRVQELEAQLKEKPKEGLTEEEIDRRAKELADNLVKTKQIEDQQNKFKVTADTLIKDAKKVDKDFEKKINEVAEDTGVKMPAYMVDILADLDNKNGHEILAQMANDDDLYEELCGLSERRMTKRLDKMSDEIKAKTKKETKKPANLPDPIEPISDGTNNRGNALPSNPTKNMDEYVRVRTLEIMDQRKLGKNVY